LALVALLVQLLLPAAGAFAMGDPMGAAPICTSGAHHTGGSGDPHKARHVSCPLCQAQSAAWGFVPPMQSFVTGPQRLARVIWRQEKLVATPAAVVGLNARGPPARA
jgi:hypothetical protein